MTYVAERFEAMITGLLGEEWLSIGDPEIFRLPWHHDHIAWQWYWLDPNGRRYRLFSYGSFTKCMKFGICPPEVPDHYGGTGTIDFEISANV